MAQDERLSVDLYIDGEWRPARSGARFDLIDPAREEVVGTAARANADDTRDAIAAAVRGFEVWRRTPAWERSKMLRRIAGLLSDRADKVARQIAIETGKTLAVCRGEVTGTIECLEWFADEARRIYGQVIEGRVPGQTFLTRYEPVGVVGAFTAWNFPVSLVARKFAPALAAGCSIVVRPAEEGTGAVSMLIECVQEAGLPKGVLNMLSGPPSEISETIMDADEVRKVTFTGSIPVGQHLMRRAADTVKRMSMELGGHGPVIVFDDVDVENVVKQSVTTKFRATGQVCVSPTRFFVQEKVADRFADRFAEMASGLKLGHPLDPDTDVGPLISRKRLDAIEGMVSATEATGARLLTGGHRPAGMNRGYFFEPTVFTDLADDAPLMTDEPFGPIAAMTSFRDVDEALERANSLRYGLAGYVFTRDMRRAQAALEGLDTGIVAVNAFQAATAEAPFGGVKHSGFGRENGAQGMLDYLDVKFVNMMAA